jgi:hypothetical protein
LTIKTKSKDIVMTRIVVHVLGALRAAEENPFKSGKPFNRMTVKKRHDKKSRRMVMTFGQGKKTSIFQNQRLRTGCVGITCD